MLYQEISLSEYMLAHCRYVGRRLKRMRKPVLEKMDVSIRFFGSFQGLGDALLVKSVLIGVDRSSGTRDWPGQG